MNTENAVITEGTVNRSFPAIKNAIKTQIGMKKKKNNVSLVINQGLRITMLPNSISKHSLQLELIHLFIKD